MSKTQEELEFEQHYAENILQILDDVVVQVAEERRIEQREAAGQPAVDNE